jgi:hypothetical protein
MDVFSIAPPQQHGAPFMVNANVEDREGRKVLQIVENEWRTPTENWDVEVVGPRINSEEN